VHKTNAFIRLAFALAPAETALTCPIQLTRWLILQKARGHPDKSGLPLLRSIRFQELFHSPSRGTFHLSLTVLVHYRSGMVFSLRRWSSQIQAGFHVSDPTQDTPTASYIFQIRGYHPLWQTFPSLSFIYKTKISESYNPTRRWFGLFPFRSSLLRESLLISFFRLLRYFSSPTCLHALNKFGRTVSR